MADQGTNIYKTAGRLVMAISQRAVTCCLLAVLCGLLCGCYILEKMDELSTLGNYSREKDEQSRLVKRIDEHYDALLSAIKAGDLIKQYPDKKSVLRAFEEPVVIDVLEQDGHKQQRWLYRHAIGLKAKDKVYLYFDAQGELIKYEQEGIS